MKKAIIIMGTALVILMNCITLTGCTNHETTPEELVAEAYLVENYGGDDYDVDIAKIDNGKVYFYWDNGEELSGYANCIMGW